MWKDKFDRGGFYEEISTAADSYSTWIPVPRCAQSVVVQAAIANTDVVGVLKFEGCNNKTLGAVTPLTFTETDGSVDTDGYAVSSGVSVNTGFEIKNRWRYVRAFYDRTSGGNATTQVVKLAINIPMN